jgi:ubiquinol-cytochrome c reductase cytochrome b subunit
MPPHLETYWLHRTWSWFIIIPLAILVVFIILVAVYPFIEAWVTGDKREHHILDRPRNAATRTAIGAAGVVFYADMWAAASGDLIATHFKLTIEGVTHAIQLMLIVGPIIAYFVTKRICIALQKKDRSLALHGYESGRIVRLPGGEFIEVHQPVDEYTRWHLVSQEGYAPLVLRPDSRGRITQAARFRSSMSRWFFSDRLTPLTQAEIEAAAHHGHGEVTAHGNPELEGAAH